MEEKNLIKKGAVVFIYNEGTGTLPIEIVVGHDILRNDDAYVNDNGTLKVQMEDIESAIEDYMCDNPYSNDYYFEILNLNEDDFEFENMSE